VIVVENGSHDRTLEIAQSYLVEHPNLTVIHEAQRGKGRAVRRGMLAARGEYRFFLDADLSMPISDVNRFFPPQLENAAVSIASREARGARRIGEPAYRHFVGRIFNTLVRWLALPGLHDTQCGFKCFRADIVEEIFPLQTLMGWSFDVELMYIARKRGYQIVEVPIDWYFNPESKVRLVQDSLRMGLDLLEIRRNGRRGVYDAAQGSPHAHKVRP
jgi:glycosyltransferase involved in cell wall biosynthesis